jgi:alpha/beta superfamily hydrolase
MFAGPDGRLEGRYHHAGESGAPLALVLHPHPMHGGTMNNRITYAMYQSFQRLGFSVMRFNFRGVGRSQGRYDGGIGEIGDAAAALDWMQMVNPSSSGLWIAGYSFGAAGRRFPAGSVSPRRRTTMISASSPLVPVAA